MDAIIFTRVSSAEQKDNYSLEAQLHRGREYCQRIGLRVIKEIQLVESSTKGARQEFTAMIDFALKHPTCVAIVCEAVDRLQRSFKESVMLADPVSLGKIELHFIRESRVIGKNANAADYMMWDFSVLGARSYVLQLRENVKRGMNQKTRSGIWGHKAPIGYVNFTDPTTGRGDVKLDERRAFLVKRIFNEYATGIASLGELVTKAQGWGLTNNTRLAPPLNKSQVYNLLRNPFYYGMMEIKGELYPHKHQALIDKATFDACNAVREGWHKKPFAHTSKPLPLRGLITCGHCGCVYSGQIKKEKYVYLNCTKNRDRNCPAPTVKQEYVFGELEQVFDALAFPQDIMEQIRQSLAESHKAKQVFHNSHVQGLQERLAKTQAQIDRLLTLLIDESITRDVYAKKLPDLQQERHGLQEQLASTQKADDAFGATLLMLLELANNAGKLFRRANVEQKRELVGLVCQNLTLTNGTLCFDLRKPFDLFMEPDKRIKWWAK